MANMLIQPLWLTHFIEILLVPEFQLTKFIVGAFSYKAHFRSQISTNDPYQMNICAEVEHGRNSTKCQTMSENDNWSKGFHQ